MGLLSNEINILNFLYKCPESQCKKVILLRQGLIYPGLASNYVPENYLEFLVFCLVSYVL